MRKFQTREVLIFLVFVFLLFGIFAGFTRLCFIADSKLYAVHDPEAKIGARRILSAYFDLLLPHEATVDYSRPAEEGDRAAYPRRFFFPIFQAEVPDNPAAFSAPPAQPHVRHPQMIPTPYVIFAPAPYESGNNFARCYHNIQQFRYQEDLTAKRADEIRIFVTGGSTAWGCLARDLNATISAFMEASLNSENNAGFHMKVINAGVGAYSTTQERIWIQNRIMAYEPDMILSYSGYNDVYAHVKDRVDLMNRLNNDAEYYTMALTEYEFYNRGEAVLRPMREFGRLFFDTAAFPKQTVANIEMTAAYLRVKGVPYVFVLQPVHEAYPLNRYILAVYPKLSAALKDAGKGGTFHFIDHSNLFDGRQHLFLDECHFGDIGNRIIAEEILKAIRPSLQSIMEKRRGTRPGTAS